MDWSDKEIERLRIEYDSSYEQLLVKFPGRTVRALKYQIGKMGLKRSERRDWSAEEKKVLFDNPNLSAKELAELLKRSEFQVAHQLRKIRGTANRRFKQGWDVPSKEFAYFLGALMSDGMISGYTMAITVKETDEEFSSRVRRFVEDVLGLQMTERFQEVELKVGVGRYRRLWSSSNQFAVNLGFSGAKGDWVMYLEKFSWVWDDPWFWSFIGGLYDGDGCLKVRDLGGSKDYPLIELAVKPFNSRKKVMFEIERRVWKLHEFSHKNEIDGFYINGGRKSTIEFLNNMDSVLSRKRL